VSAKIETHLIVDIESSGPIPSQYALLSIGACTLNEPRQTFYIELQPDSELYTEDANQIHGLSQKRLAEKGIPPAEAMQKFADWIGQATPDDTDPVFTALNAPFDWMFINDYFHRYLGHNPFGHKALDIKAYYMGLHGASWEETSYKNISKTYQFQRKLSHNALDDALDTAELFLMMLAEVRKWR